MKKSRFKGTQIASILESATDETRVIGIRRKHRISESTCNKRKSKYGGIKALDIKQVRELETDNSRSKRMYADLALENTDLSADFRIILNFGKMTLLRNEGVTTANFIHDSSVNSRKAMAMTNFNKRRWCHYCPHMFWSSISLSKLIPAMKSIK